MANVDVSCFYGLYAILCFYLWISWCFYDLCYVSIILQDSNFLVTSLRIKSFSNLVEEFFIHEFYQLNISVGVVRTRGHLVF